MDHKPWTEPSNVNRRPVRRVRCLTHRLRHCRVRVDGSISSSTVHSNRRARTRLGYEFGCSRTDDVHAEHFVVLLIGHNLDEAIGLGRHARTRQGFERERTHPHVVPLLLRLALGQARHYRFRARSRCIGARDRN